MRVAALVLAIAIAPTLFGAAPARSVTVRIEPRHGSSERGMATLTRRGSDVIVDVRMTGLGPDAPTQLVHLHTGSCDRLSLHGAIDLEPLAAGHSRTILRGADATDALNAKTHTS